ncbi:MAG: TaqI-like C-terminal specificity domain-containing protein [Candidatus Firestonebacteria bacterium]
MIRVTPSHRAKIEEKPEVRKAGGVYYTPQYVVEYIVQNTVGKLIAGKTPEEISKIKIVDPACGSGSFLIGAYQYLLDFHKNYYSNNGKPSKGKKESCLTPEGHLTTAEKKRILLNNIFGVDIDVNAVEVTKLSLLLKCMEGETSASIAHQFKMFNERVLPTLDENIKDGNSLIDTDFYKNELFEVEKKIKPFNWQKGFPEVYKQNGFDVVIGNPPWVSLNGKFGNDILNPQAQQYLINKYHGNTYMPNLYEYFVHKGLELINDVGVFSFIVPDRLGFNNQFVTLRKKLLQHFKIEELLYKAPFPGIVTDTLIFRFSTKKKSENSYKINVGEFGKSTQTKTKQEYLQNPEHQFSYESNDNATKILNKIFASKKCNPLGEIADTTSGFGGKSTEITETRTNQKQIEVIRGRSIQKFSGLTPYFFEFKKENITGRTTDKEKLGVKEKVLLRKTGYPIIATYDESGIFPEQSLYFIFNNKTKNSLKYFTALINSNLFQFIFINKLVTNKDSTPQLKKVDLDKFPVYVCDFKNQNEKSLHDEIVKLVDQLLKLNEEKAEAKLETKINQLKSKIDYCESRINEIVYQLYELTEAEIKIVEEKQSK